MMKEFENGWPSSFHNTILKKIVTMSDKRKKVKTGTSETLDTNIIYSRVIGLQASSRDIDIHQVLSCELSPVPTSMFLESGEMRLCTSKSSMKSYYK